MMATETAAPPVWRLEWQLAQVRDIVVETSSRLTAEDGYQAQRSYSIASPLEDELIKLTVERVNNGEVSPYLFDDLRAGDQFELRGPIGGYFVWTVATRGPLWLIAGFVAISQN